MLAQPQRICSLCTLCKYQRCPVSSTNLYYLWKNIMTQLAGFFLLTWACWLGQFANAAINPALREAPEGTLEWGYQISASVISLRIQSYSYEVDPATGLHRESKYDDHSWSYIGRTSGSILNPRERNVLGHLAVSLLATWMDIKPKPRKGIYRLLWGQRADFMVFCSVKRWRDWIFRKVCFQGGVQRLFLHPAFFIL